MSLSCPRCGNSIEQDFGMITCGQCQTILFIDMEGQIQIAGDESAASPTDSIAQASDVDSPVQESSEPADANQAYAGASHEPVAAAYEADVPPVEAEPTPQFQPSSPVDVPAASAMQFASEAQESVSSSELFSEVSDFGNNKQDFGALSYTLHIENIDTGEIRQKLAEALTDSKFQWDVNELLQKIEKGRLEIAQINPVKASILVHRLQEVPVRVSWDQKLL